MKYEYEGLTWREKGICQFCRESETCHLWNKTKDTIIYDCNGFTKTPLQDIGET